MWAPVAHAGGIAAGVLRGTEGTVGTLHLGFLGCLGLLGVLKVLPGTPGYSRRKFGTRAAASTEWATVTALGMSCSNKLRHEL
jgi:hypothetical protein